MSLFKYLSIFIFLLIAQLLFTATHEAAEFEIQNSCPYTVWAASVPGGGRKLDQGQAWIINVQAGTSQARIWARTNCDFDGSGRGSCQTGDCNGLLQCQSFGAPPVTLAEYALNQFDNLDFFDVSLVDGFNVPMEFSPTSSVCTRGVSCIADIVGQCPNELKAPGGCNNPCTVFKTDQYCCNSGNCGPTAYSRFFKQRCPSAYSYPKDDQTSTFTCPGGTNYKVVFCPALNPPAQTVVDIRNNCPFKVWAAAVPGGGQLLEYGGTWRIDVSTHVRIWGRANCIFDISTGKGHCQTGDCNGLLECQAHGNPPSTLAEYAFNKFSNLVSFKISLVNGFNIPMKLIPTSTDGCSDDSTSCTADIIGQCPNELRTPGGCNDPCTVFNTDEYCCKYSACPETDYSHFFNARCPNSYRYPGDDATNTLTCPGGTNYRVVFCP